MLPSAIQTQEALEYKLFYRRGDRDPVVTLLYTLLLLKDEQNYKAEHFLAERKDLRTFVDKCFFCGCLPNQAGKMITYFVLEPASIFSLFKKIKILYPSPFVKRSYQIAVIEELFNYLLDTLKKENNNQYEHILIYNKNGSDIMRLKRSNLYKLRDFYTFFGSKINKSARPGDDIAAIYSALRIWQKNEGDTRIYLTLPDDIKPPLAAGIGGHFVFCTKSNRKDYESCRTKAYIRDYILSVDRKYKAVYDFAGLPFVDKKHS